MAHKVLRTDLSGGVMGFPDVSFHGVAPWKQDGFGGDEHYVGVMFAGYERDNGAEVVYVASNAYWGELDVTLPELPLSMHWELVCNTWEAFIFISPCRVWPGCPLASPAGPACPHTAYAGISP